MFSSYPSNYLPIATDMVKAHPNLIQGLAKDKAEVSMITRAFL